MVSVVHDNRETACVSECNGSTLVLSLGNIGGHPDLIYLHLVVEKSVRQTILWLEILRVGSMTTAQWAMQDCWHLLDLQRLTK